MNYTVENMYNFFLSIKWEKRVQKRDKKKTLCSVRLLQKLYGLIGTHPRPDSIPKRDQYSNICLIPRPGDCLIRFRYQFQALKNHNSSSIPKVSPTPATQTEAEEKGGLFKVYLQKIPLNGKNCI